MQDIAMSLVLGSSAQAFLTALISYPEHQFHKERSVSKLWGHLDPVLLLQDRLIYVCNNTFNHYELLGVEVYVLVVPAHANTRVYYLAAYGCTLRL